MHPMFVTLFLPDDTDDLLAEEESRRRAVNRARLSRSRLTTRATTPDRNRRPRR